MEHDGEGLARETMALRRVARGVLLDPSSADDAVQEAWLAALRHPQAASEGWLREAVRRIARGFRRGAARAGAREREAARGEAQPSTLETAARLEVLRELVLALESLPEPYRTAVRLRYVDDLPPRAIAARLGLPVETVRTHVKRGLERLRARLDAGHARGRDSLLAALAPLAGLRLAPAPLADAPPSPTALLPRPTLEGLLAMTAQTKIAVVTLALAALLALTFRLARDGDPVAPPVAAGEAPSTATLEAPASAPVPADEPAQGARESAPAPETAARPEMAASAPTHGSMLVRVLWGDDGTPAADVIVDLRRQDSADPLFDAPRGVSDERGEVRFAQLAPGRLYTDVKRGGSTLGRTLQVVAGEEALAVVELEAGMDLRGEVVDERGSPIEGAEVLVSPWADEAVLALARTDEHGRFRLRCLATHCHVGARAAGFAASHLRQFTASEGAQVEMRIVLSQPGTELRGVVLDPLGEAVPGAVVELGASRQSLQSLPDGTMAKLALPLRQHTGPEGAFAFHGIAEGSVTLSVRAPGLAPWQEKVEVLRPAGAPLAIHLLPGVTLVGTVRDRLGAALEDVTIRVGEWGELAHRSVDSDARGEFRIEGLPVGELTLRAESQALGKAELRRKASAGETVRWEPVLVAGLAFRGRVVDASGNPVARAMVESRRESTKSGAHWFAFENTDEDGRFTLRDCEPLEPIRIDVRRKSIFPELTLHGVLPDNEELVIRMPKEAWVRIRGRVVGPDDQPLDNVHVAPFLSGGNSSPAETTEAGTGKFDLGPYPPGEYAVQFQAEGFPKILVPRRQLEPDEVWDLGTLRFEAGGWLEVTAAKGPTELAAKAQWRILGADGLERGKLDVAEGAGRSIPLAPGQYLLQVAGGGAACAIHPFEIRSELGTRLELELRAGVPASVELSGAPGAELQGQVRVEVRDAAGADVLRTTLWAAENRARLAVALLPGTYRVVAESAGRSGEGSLQVDEAGPASAAITVGAR